MEGAGFEITCVNKNHTGIIVRIGGVGWSLSTQEAIQKLMSQQLRFNLLLGNRYLDVGVRGSGTDAYLVIEPEGYALHDIEQIPSCG
ncbi:MAG: DUF3892 domain-containing protein [Anaerolineales bacterium]